MPTYLVLRISLRMDGKASSSGTLKQRSQTEQLHKIRSKGGTTGYPHHQLLILFTRPAQLSKVVVAQLTMSDSPAAPSRGRGHIKSWATALVTLPVMVAAARAVAEGMRRVSALWKGGSAGPRPYGWRRPRCAHGNASFPRASPVARLLL